jgi:hypothetical protein
MPLSFLQVMGLPIRAAILGSIPTRQAFDSGAFEDLPGIHKRARDVNFTAICNRTRIDLQFR